MTFKVFRHMRPRSVQPMFHVTFLWQEDTSSFRFRLLVFVSKHLTVPGTGRFRSPRTFFFFHFVTCHSRMNSLSGTTLFKRDGKFLGFFFVFPIFSFLTFSNFHAISERLSLCVRPETWTQFPYRETIFLWHESAFPARLSCHPVFLFPQKVEI